jgi:hypothetical protein
MMTSAGHLKNQSRCGAALASHCGVTSGLMEMRLWQLFPLFDDGTKEVIFRPRSDNRRLHALLHPVRNEAERLNDSRGTHCCESGCSHWTSEIPPAGDGQDQARRCGACPQSPAVCSAAAHAAVWCISTFRRAILRSERVHRLRVQSWRKQRKAGGRFCNSRPEQHFF